ncbi:AbrB/MazE/SpoVT family DNA-binding domain-containing protein [Brevibacterium album]|uniref:AbrB/MazE/SpoVT family DNA-binding domain-containing protein n=1 Tax=Brevibacterium album TaxID=417948 RepID=UPI00040A5A00|nr:AbrB/MazE/SpoVT family DNA-binding domain-containing protein [Brevibacterium album]
MRLNSKGQVTIPAELRRRFGFAEGDEVDVIAGPEGLRIVHRDTGGTPGERAVRRLRGRATTDLSTDELMEMLRGD